jgi:hypothetical protein
MLAMSGAAWASIAAISGASIGFVGGLVTTSVTWRRERAERRRDERLRAYSEFVASVTVTAHHIGNLADTDHEPTQDRRDASSRFDTDVTPRYQLVAMLGSAAARSAGADLYEALRSFRRGVADVTNPPRYRTPEYEELRQPMLRARQTFVDVASREMNPGSAPHTGTGGD